MISMCLCVLKKNHKNTYDLYMPMCLKKAIRQLSELRATLCKTPCTLWLKILTNSQIVNTYDLYMPMCFKKNYNLASTKDLSKVLFTSKRTCVSDEKSAIFNFSKASWLTA